MSDRKDKIVRLLSEAEPDVSEDGRKTRELAMTAVVIGAVVLTAVIAYYLFIPQIERAKERAEEAVASAETGVAQAEARAQLAEAEAERMHEMHLYSAQMPIDKLKLNNHLGVLHASGVIKNVGRRPVNDIELTAVVVDEDGEVLSEHVRTTKSPDGQPLYRWQQRRFHFEVSVPPGGKDVHVVITGIDFD